MTVNVVLEAQLRTATGQSRLPLELPPEATLHVAIQRLADLLGESAKRYLVTDAGLVRPSLLILLDGEAVLAEEADGYILHAGSELLLMPPIAGG